MEIAKEIGGFSLFEAEDLRRAIGKKDHALMASLKDKFIEGCVANNTSDSVARQLWEDMEKAQDYSFNKAHAACYALISYRTAWLKAHHPCEYMAALISSVMNTKDRVPFYVNACHELGIEVLPPDVNESQIDFAVVGGKIRFGLNAVKGVGELAVPHDHPGARGGRAVRVDLGLHRARRPVRRQQARPRVARQVRRAARLADGDAAGARAGARLRAEAAGRPARRPGLDLRRAVRLRRRGRASGTIRRFRPRSSRSPTCCGSRRRRSASTSPSTRSRRCGPSCARRPTRRSPSSSGAATARPSSSAASSARSGSS